LSEVLGRMGGHISDSVDSRRDGICKMANGSMGPEEKPYCLQSQGTHLSLAGAGVFGYFSEEISSRPRFALRKGSRGG
jgi:hypothetical protein